MRYTLFALLIGILLLPQTAYTQKHISLREAILQKIVTVQFKGLGGFNKKAVSVVISNKSKHAVNLAFEAGEFLQPDNASEQRLLTAEDIIVVVQPKQTVEQTVYAFCSQHHNSAPSRGMNFSATGRASKSLVDLMTLVKDHRYYSSAAQEAVWCLTDNGDIQWLISDNATEEKDLRTFVAAVKGIDLTKLPKVKRTKYIYEFVGKQTKRPKLDIDYTDRTGGEKGKTIEQAQKNRDEQDEKAYKEAKEMENWAVNEIVGSINVHIAKPAKIRIVILQPNGETLAEVYKSEDIVAGKAKLPFKYQKYNLPRGIYTIQVQDEQGGVLATQAYELK